MLHNRHHYSIPELLIIPNGNSVAIKQKFPSPPAPANFYPTFLFFLFHYFGLTTQHVGS